MKYIAILASTLLACITQPADPRPDETEPEEPAEPPGMPVQGAKRVFVTSTVYEGGLLGGLVGADAKCAARASAAGLSGTYKAWLSTAAASARDRLTHSTDAYTLVDGTTVVASNWGELISGTLQHAIDHDEFDKAASGPETCAIVGGLIPAWTGTNFDGSHAADFDCGGWAEVQRNGQAGNLRATTSKWTGSLCAPSCTYTAALYCVEQ